MIFSRAGVFCGFAIALFSISELGFGADEFRQLSIEAYRDKMAGGWLGQMAGVGWGGPTEFRWKGQIIPAESMPPWRPELINQFHQDDIYVEMTFLRTLEVHGWDVSIRQAGIDFANSGYRLWHANMAGRTNLRNGIAPPDSGHPAFNKHADDIDYQIEADYSGLIAPGMPQIAIDLGELFGRLMNYGDGLYGGQFVGGMYAEAFFEDEPRKLIEAGLACIPAASEYARCIRDVLAWHKEHPDDWEKTWHLINDKYHLDPKHRRFSCSGPTGEFNIDAKINGAYIVMGLLYGAGDMDRTIIISTRCGQDSDCNPANAAGILGTVLGRSGLPVKFTSAIDPKGKFSHTPYTFPALVEVSEKLVRQAVVRAGGRIERDASEQETLVIPVQTPMPSKLESCGDPDEPQEIRFTDDEMSRITAFSESKQRDQVLQPQVDQLFPGWKISNCGPDMEPGMRAEYAGRQNVLMTHPLIAEVGCALSRKIEISVQGTTTLQIVVGNDARGDFTLEVKANGERLLRKKIGEQEEQQTRWEIIEVDLSSLAGQSVNLELVNDPDGWRYEAAYWAKIAVVTE